MDLLEKIKRERARNKRKLPLERTLFDTVSGLVKKYRLEESFLASLEVPEDCLSGAQIVYAQMKQKSSMEFPLFSLSTEKEYRLTTAIMRKVNNPYLEFARSPEEIGISAILFDLNPSLGEETLAGYHFETLLLCERAKREIEDLLKQARKRGEKNGAGPEKECERDEGSLPESLEKRIEQLKSLVARVDDLGRSHS